MLGTASSATCYLLVECYGAWPARVAELFEGSNLSDHATACLRQFIDWCPEEVHPLLVRAPRERKGHRIYLVRAGTAVDGRPAGRRLLLDDHAELSLELLQRAYEHPRPFSDLLLVCTHGKRDKCCAKFGAKVVGQLRRRLSDKFEVFECSHMGGDRFAANAFWLPWGLCLGHLQTQMDAVVAAFNRQRIPLACLRGDAALPDFAQYLEGRVRQHYRLDQPGGVKLVSCQPVDGETHETADVTLHFDALDHQQISARVRIRHDASTGDKVLASCNDMGYAYRRVFELVGDDSLTPQPVR